MNNLGINPYNYNYGTYPLPQVQTNPVTVPQTIAPQISPNNGSFEDNYWKYQTALGTNMQIAVNNHRSRNMDIARSIINDYYAKYPNLQSFTMSETLAKNLEKNNASPDEIQRMKDRADKDFKTMIEILEKRPEFKDITFDEYINMIKQEFAQYNHANCGERAYYLHNEMNKKGIDNAVIEIDGKSASNSHVFNVIGLEKNADINNPETWGDDAIIIDVWAHKTVPAKEAIAYYKDFLNYGENNPMTFKKLDINEIFKSS